MKETQRNDAGGRRHRRNRYPRGERKSRQAAGEVGGTAAIRPARQKNAVATSAATTVEANQGVIESIYAPYLKQLGQMVWLLGRIQGRFEEGIIVEPYRVIQSKEGRLLRTDM